MGPWPTQIPPRKAIPGCRADTLQKRKKKASLETPGLRGSQGQYLEKMGTMTRRKRSKGTHRHRCVENSEALVWWMDGKGCAH